MKVIYKYEITVQDYTMIPLPKGAKILTVQTQRGKSQMWALVDTEAKKEIRHFFLAGTGHELPKDIDAMTYIGSFQMHDENLIFHLFEMTDYFPSDFEKVSK